ncbi:tudor domain-containing protein 5 [Nephila pilipes]|uniref:Tudor domain-containing protein 5 n=1 Tax=Nephila pilipes TaxID=299642 RepID=A0A8X6MNA8_NEPPI|nr:tudor domain-containing protein 5 [Nephila pilipes]
MNLTGIMGQLDFDNVKKEIRSVLISVKEGLTLREFLKAYRNLVGIRFPSRELGYTTDIDLLNSIPEVVHVQENRDGSFLLRGIADDTTEHIQNLVQKQKSVKKKTTNQSYVTNITRLNQMSASVKMDKCRPFVPAQLRLDIIQIVKQYPEGIGYTALMTEYSKTFSKNLNLIWLSSNPSVQFEKLVSVIPELKLKTVGNSLKLCFVDNFQKTSRQADVSRSRHQNITGAVVTSDVDHQQLSSVIPVTVKQNFEKVLKMYPNGILVKHFPILYQKCTNQPFDLHELGFTSVLELAKSLPQIFYMVKGNSLNDWFLYHIKDSKFAPQNLEKPKTKTLSSDKCTENVRDIISPSLMYIKSELPVEAKIKYIPVFISAINNPSCFWFQLQTKEAIQGLKKLEKEMEIFYNSSSSSMYKMANNDIAVGAICATFCKDDSQWYRTVITAMPSIESVIVDFVDYGSFDKVPRSSLYYLRNSFTHLPTQAFLAELAFIKPRNKKNTWNLAAQKRFHDLCNRPYLMAQIDSIGLVTSLFLCDSIGEDDIHINDVLVEEDLAEYCINGTSDYESSLELSDDYLSEGSLPSNPLGTKRESPHSNYLSKTSISMNPTPINQGNRHKSPQFFCKRVLLGDNYVIHILSVRNEAYVSGADLCNLFWKDKSENVLADRLKCKDVIVPTISVSREEFKDLFEKCERYSVKGFHDSLVTLYPLKYCIKILNSLGHPSEISREAFITEIENFDPNNVTWQKLAEESEFLGYVCDSGNAIERLCLYDLKALKEGLRYKRAKYLESLKDCSDEKLYNELINLDKTHTAIVKRIKEIEEICNTYSKYM